MTYEYKDKERSYELNNIESRFYKALHTVANVEIGYGRQYPPCYFKLVSPQTPIDLYIVDFYIETWFGSKVAVEIDGQEYHKTKEQRFHDYQRERYLQKRNVQVVRFTGTEVFINAEACVENLLEILQEWDKRYANLVRMTERDASKERSVSSDWNKLCSLLGIGKFFPREV